MTGPTPQLPQVRPVDVDTGFWLWLAALPLMVIGYAADLLTAPIQGGRTAASMLVYVAAGLFAVVICAITVTFLILMRAGYRWARTLVSGGGLATVGYVAIRLFTVNWPPVWAVICAATGIVGSVLIVGGVVLVHRKDAHAYFTR
ncbi:MAG: hypothetical protein K2Q25_10110 [Mycobacteriaceae bacterium]|nr:hypothetical protein [Mycobacteriaceae bacterium]